MKHFGILTTLIALAVLLAACAAPASSVQPAVTAASATVEPQPSAIMDMQAAQTATAAAVTVVTTGEVVKVDIKDFSFRPPELTIKVGTTVEWTNRDSVGHTATSDDGLFDTGLLAKGKSATFTFTAAGTYGYFCTPHPRMRAVIIVVE